MIRLLVLLLIGAIVSGCETTGDALTTNAAPTRVTGPTASAIAGDMASRLAEQVGPAATTTFKLDTDNSDYAKALEAALKGWGYVVIADGKASKDRKSTELAWSVEMVDGHVLARLTTPAIVLGRAYLPTAAGATPASPLSIMQRN